MRKVTVILDQGDNDEKNVMIFEFADDAYEDFDLETILRKLTSHADCVWGASRLPQGKSPTPDTTYPPPL